MTDKARELLKQIVAWWDDDKEFIGDFVDEIRAYLAEPEQDSLKDDEAWEKGFRQGIKFAKARYGITGGESND